MENILGVLGIRYKTDKILGHGYHRFYHDVLNNFCDKHINMLEIGVARYNSVDMWKEYFPFAKVYGIDLNNEYKDERLCILKADQSNKEQLLDVIKRMNVQCSFINDDGSHIPEHQLLTFDLFFDQLLEEGGIYIIEDIETSYWKRNGLYGYNTRYGYMHSNSLIEKFKILIDYINSKYLSESDKKLLLEKIDFISHKTVNMISSITFAQNCIIIKKKNEYEYIYSEGSYNFKNNV